MKRAVLGRTGIEVSRLGFGTGTAHPDGLSAQSLLRPEELAALLLHGVDRGVDFWDTALAYGTHRHVKEALRGVRRSQVVIATKLTTSEAAETRNALQRSLAEIGTGYVDVCLVHGVRTAAELKRREGALEAMCEARERGDVRAVGISSHGLGALRSAAERAEIDVVWGRINAAGLCMDSCRPGLYDRMASVPWLKRAVRKAVPRRIRSAARPAPEQEKVGEDGRAEVEQALRALHRQGRGVVGMKVLAEGALRGDPEKAIGYVATRSFVDAFVIGMTSRAEIDRNCLLV